MGHLAATINAVERCRRLKRIKAEMGFAGATSERVTTGVLQQPDGFGTAGSSWLRQQAFLPTPLPLPGLLERNELLRLKKKCRRPTSGIRRRY